MSEPVLLRDGSVAALREIEPADADAVRALHEALSAESLHLRFMGSSRIAAQRAVQALVRPRGDDHVSLLAEQEGRVLGVAVFERVGPEAVLTPTLAPAAGDGCGPGSAPELAEVAFLVADDQHGRGIATLLFERLAELAARRGIDAFVAEVLTSNSPMLRVIADLGYPVRSTSAGGVIEARIDLETDDRFRVASEARLRRAELLSLRSLLNPQAIAVVGAGNRKDKVGGAVLANVLESGFAGGVYPVSLHERTVQGLPAYPSLRELPGPVDLVVFATPAQAVPALMADCRAAGATSAVVLAAGFADDGDAGRALQSTLVDRAREHGVRIVGPNCLGIVTTTDAGRLAATFAPALPRPGNVGVLTQSGGMAIALVEHARRAGIGLSHLLSVGNKADVSGNDMLTWWMDDPDTQVCVLYLESFGNPRRFARLARELAARKPVVVVKAGSSVPGARAVHSHTAAGLSPQRSVAALLRQAGVIQVNHIGELVEVVSFLAAGPLPPGDRLAVLSNAGGVAILATDAAAEYGLRTPELAEELQQTLRTLLPAAAKVAGPVDTTPGVELDAFVRAAELIAGAPEVDALLVALTPTPLADADAVADALASAALPADKPVVLVLTQGVSAARRLVPELPTHGAAPDGRRGGRELPVFAFPESAVRAVARAAEYARNRRRHDESPPLLSGTDRTGTRHLARRSTVPGAQTWLAPDAAAALLAGYGISTLETRVAVGAEAARTAAEAVGYPVALKAVGDELVHRSDVGGVVLDLRSAEQLEAAYASLETRLSGRMTAAAVQPMAGPGVEMIVGIAGDPRFGPLIVCGLGGVWSDLLDDRAYRLTPLTATDAAEMVRELKGYPLLNGFRGTPAADVTALEHLLLRVARLADDVPEIEAIDLNPVIVHPHGITVVDAKVCVRPVP